jgi:hypothetical protein
MKVLASLFISELTLRRYPDYLIAEAAFGGRC